MKVIIGGSTGFVGLEVLSQCLSDERITSIIALARREVPSTDPKLKFIKIDDFNTYSDEVLRQCEGASACIWSLGTPRDPDIETTRRINVDYTMAAANTFKSLGSESTPFRFVYVSGMMVEKDQEKNLWFMSAPRKIRGETELLLEALPESSNKTCETYIAKPGYIFNPASMMPAPLRTLGKALKVNELAAVLIDLAVNGSKQQTYQASELGPLGDRLLKAKAKA